MRVRRVLRLVFSMLLLGIVAQPAAATDEPIQTLNPSTSGADEVWVGLSSDGQATAVWAEIGGIYWANRASGGGFGSGKKIAGSDGADQVTFHESPNGNAVVAWTTGRSEGDLMASVRIGTSGSFGAGQVLAPTSATGVQAPDSSISDAGRAAVVWMETNATGQVLIKAALSSSSGDFGSSATLATDRVLNPRVDMSDAGAALAVWDLDVASGTDEIQASSATASGSFGAIQTIEQLEQGPGKPDVAVNAGGNAVVTWADFASDAQGCCSRDVLEARYGDVAGQFGALQLLTDVTNPTATGDHEAAVDNSGRAAIVFSAHMNSSYGLFGAVSDATGTFGVMQTISHANTVTSGLDRASFEVAAGGGEFTAFWNNDPDADDADESFHSTTSAGQFGAPHQVSPDSPEQMSQTHGARNSQGEIVSAWIQVGKARVAPATAGAADTGTDGDDQLSGSSGDDTIRLLGGDDLYNAGGGNDSVYGDTGQDQLAGGGGNDLLDGGADGDQLIGGAGGDTLKGSGGNDTLTGDGVNAISGSSARPYLAVSGPDILLGGGGADKLIGGGGVDRFNGGPGRDVCHVDSRREKRQAKGCETIRLRRSR